MIKLKITLCYIAFVCKFCERILGTQKRDGITSGKHSGRVQWIYNRCGLRKKVDLNASTGLRSLAISADDYVAGGEILLSLSRRKKNALLPFPRRLIALEISRPISVFKYETSRDVLERGKIERNADQVSEGCRKLSLFSYSFNSQ